ncbi:Fanconi anemia group M protein-like [Lytechinus pictus]|uniref:Fanconi anemia group M protein-like n=1 Tax=Lytechinus pictus TaxID=7653 RepID=UPI0030B9F990
MNRKTSATTAGCKSSKQTTLFQNWSTDQNVRENEGLPSKTNQQNEMDEQFDEETLLAACEEWEMEELGNCSTTGPHPPEATPLEDLPGFDVSAGHIYIYPTNYPLRDYQFNIVSQALLKNTLVTLPTGLGKTFIAAVVMYNFYRWYPRGKIVFMAPTKPLVFQQIEACFNIMGIPQEDMAEMTGNMHPPERKKSWQRQRVFFLTPQVMTNDLSRRACPATEVKCVVVDEAHKALGNQAYCQVIRELSKYTNQFRVLALSATPGGDIKAVNEVLTNLLISHIEIRSEDSIDIRQYVHERKVEKIVVPIGDELKQVKEQYLKILTVFVNRLVRCRVLFCRDLENLTKFQILKSREQFRQDPPPEITAARRGPVEGDFAICMSLYHGFELLLQHGQRSLYSFLQNIVDGTKANARTRSELMRNSDFSNLVEMLEAKYAGSMMNSSHNISHNSSHNSSGLFTSMLSPSLRATGSKVEEEEYVMSHPKMTKLKEVVLEHFEKFTSGNQMEAGPSTSRASNKHSTRVMIFAQYRDSVQEITQMLNRHQPTVRCMSFIGQASAGKNTKGFSQKEQIRVVNEFKNGGYNTLVSTCVGEEGLDIGDVDLIVCFDAHKSPIRLVQRMGRTGRKRQGRIVMLVTEGKESAIYDRSQYSKKGIHRALQGNSKSLHLFPASPRMVPRGLNPTAHKMNIKVGEYQSKHKTKMAAPSSATTSKKKSSMGGDISRFLQGTKPDPAEDVFLTYEELVFWNLHYKVDQGEQLKAPGESKFLSLNKQAAKEVSLTNDKELSLNSYAEWQTNKQPTHKVSHSQRCAVFVEMMEFFEIQGHTEDEDIYGAEMAMYLDEGDVLRPNEKESKGKEGILKYCSQEKKNQKETDIVILDEDEGDGDHKERTRKIKKKAKVRKRAKSTSSEMENLGSDDGLPAVDLFSEPSEKQDGYSENTEEHKGKAKKGRKSDDGSSSDGKVGRTKRGKSPRGGQESRLKRKTIPLPCDSDENDFDTDRKSVTPPRPVVANTEGEVKQQKSVNTKEDMTDSDQGALNDEPMDTASDDNQVEPCAASPSSPSKNQQEHAKGDASLNTSDIFLSCSQVFRAPEVPSGASKRDKRTSERSNGEGEADVMPPPPPSLSGLDLLDDIDLSFNASQLAKEDIWTKSSPKRESHRPEIGIALDEPVIVPPLPLNGKETMKFEKHGEELNMRTNLVTSETFSKTVQNDNGLDISSTASCHINHDMDDEFGKVLDSDADEVDEAVSNFENGKINQEEADEPFLISPVLTKHSLKKCVQVQQSVDDIDHEEETKNITDELVDAWDNFEGDIFDDDDDDVVFDREPVSNHLTKSPILSTNVKKVVGRKGDVKNDTAASHAYEAHSEDTDQRNGFKVSTASHSIKPWTDVNHGMTERPGIEINHKEEIGSAVLCSSSNQLQKIQPQLEHEITDENEIKHTQQPKFDLDFDFGDFFEMDDEAFDEIGIVPPSPQVSQKRSGFMAMSQASQSMIRPERDARTSHTDKDGSKVDIIGEQEAKLKNNPTTQNQVIPTTNCGLSALESSKPSKIEVKTSSLSRFKRNLMHPVNTNDSKVVASLAQPEKIETADLVGNVYKDTVSRVSHPPAASTPVMSDVERDGRHQGSTVSPIGQSGRRDIFSPVETPSSHLQKAKPLGSLRSRLRIKRKDGSGPKQSEGLSIQDQSSRPTALPGKRKSSPLVDEGHFEDPVLSNPLKKPKTSLKEETSLSPHRIEGHVIKPSLGLKSGKINDKDDINFLLEGIDWEDSFLSDNKPTIPDRVNDGFDNKRDSTDSTTSKKGTHISSDDDANLSHHLKDDDEDSDDSQDVIGRVTKKKRAVVLTSPDTPMAFNASLRSRLAAKASIVKEKSVHVLSDESSDDSSFIIQPKKRKAKKILDMSSTIIIPEGDDDDFEDPMKQGKLVKNIEREQRRDDILLKHRLEKKEKRNKHKKSLNHRRKAAHFLDEEAEVSEDEEWSSDEEGSDLDNSLEGFINNASQSSQTTCPRDMHAIYMKSVKSPPVPGPGGRFKMVQHHSPDLDVFSQVPQQDATYMEDSFVVQGDDEEDHGLREDISLLAMDNTINMDNIIDGGSRRAGGRRLRNKGGESRAARILRAGRAAVLKSDSSLSDVEEAVEDDDLMDWEIELDFEARKKNQKRNHAIHQASGRGRLLGNHRGLGKGMESSKPSGGEWISKPKTQSQPFQVNPKNVHDKEDGLTNVQGASEKEKSPLKTNYALMNSGRTKDSLIGSDKGSSKPCTFVAPQSAAACSSGSSLMDSPKTLAQKEKEERLRRQKQKQAEFQQKMQQKQAQTSSQAAISPVKRTLSLSSGSRKKEEASTEKTSVNRTLSFATPGSNPRAAFPNSEGFKVPWSSEGSLNTKTDSGNSDTSSKNASPVLPNQNISLLPVRSTTAVSPSNKINNLTLMDNSVANATMSSTIVNSSTLSSPRSATGQAPLVILVDSKELSSSPHIVSTLTITYGLNPIVSQLQGCDYVTSTRMGVEKRTLSEFANGANRQKLLDRVRHMCELFDRPCLIIEKDRDKNRDKRQPPKTLIRTKYLDSTLASLTKTHVKVLFSDSTEETAQILADLTKIESRKGAAIPATLDMDSTSEQVLKFYQSIPGVSYVTALSLIHHYPSVADLLSTCESVLQSRIKVSSIRAKQIMAYLNHSFDEQMTGSR